MSRWRRSRPRPLWRTAGDSIIFLLVLVITVEGLRRGGMIDLGSGNATAKDGDSLVLNGTEVRLHGIDAPEYNQHCDGPQGDYPCGREAHAALKALLRGQTISCKSVETDRYGRAVSDCRTDKISINREMVRQGWAVAYIRHSTAYVGAQREAKAARRGIWQGRFDMPEDYRARTRPVTGDVGGVDMGSD